MYRKPAFLLLALVVLIPGCSVVRGEKIQQPVFEEGPVYNLVNLHYSSGVDRISSVNYQYPGLLPRCTEVKFTEIREKRAVFVVPETGENYSFNMHRNTQPASIVSNLKKLFGTSCEENPGGLNEVDKTGIRTGKVLKGMTKQGVIYAIGYPPPHRTPSTNANKWHYWDKPMDEFIVHFDNQGIVSRIHD